MKLSFKIFISVVFSFAMTFILSSDVEAYTPIYDNEIYPFSFEPQYDFINEVEIDALFSPLITALNNKGLNYIINFISTTKGDYSFNDYTYWKLTIFRDINIPFGITAPYIDGKVYLGYATCKNTQYISPSDCSSNDTLYNSKVIASYQSLFTSELINEYTNYINSDYYPTTKWFNTYYTTSSTSYYTNLLNSSFFKNTRVSPSFIYQSSFDIELTDIFHFQTLFEYNNGFSTQFYGVGDIMPTYKNSTIIPTAPSLTIDSEDIIFINEYDTNFTPPTATAIDTIDGDISDRIEISDIQLGFGVDFGKRYIEYNVCNFYDLCTTKKIYVEYTDGLTELDLTGKYGVLFYFKNWTTIQNNSMCTGTGEYLPCLKYYFKYIGHFKYGSVPLPYDPSINYENTTDGNSSDGKIEQGISYKDYKEIMFFHNTNSPNFNEYATAFYVFSDGNSKIKYNADLFDYRILDNKYSNVDDIDYVDLDGNSNTDVIPGLPDVDMSDFINIGEGADSFFNTFSTAIDYITNIVSSIFSYCSDIFLGLDTSIKYYLVSAFSIGIFVIIVKIIL